MTTGSDLQKTGSSHFCTFYMEIVLGIHVFCNLNTLTYQKRLEVTFHKPKVANYLLVYKQKNKKRYFFGISVKEAII